MKRNNISLFVANLTNVTFSAGSFFPLFFGISKRMP